MVDMSNEWTIKRLDETGDLLFISTILNERRNKLHPYAPLAKKIGKVLGKIDRKNIFCCPSGKVFNAKSGRCVRQKKK